MREQILPTARMHYFIEDGGHAVNVVPDYAKVQFRYRGPNADNIRQNIAWVKDIARGAALATQTKETITVVGGCLDCLPNDVLATLAPQYSEVDSCDSKVGCHAAVGDDSARETAVMPFGQ